MSQPAKLLRFEGFELDPVCGTLRANGQPIDIRPKTSQVLAILAQNSGRLVTKDEIMRAVWPDVVVTEDSLVRCVHELRLALGDTNQRLVRTLPRRGYMFAVPVSATEPDNDASQMAERPKRRLHGVRPLPFALLGILVLIAGLWVGRTSLHSQGASADSGRFSIAVLPFADLTGDLQNKALSHALAEDLLTNLTLFPELQVVAKASPDRKAPVQYLLDGSIRSGAAGWHVTARLMDAHSMTQVWASSYAGANGSINQDGIAQEIASSIVSKVRRVDVERIAKYPTNKLTAGELVLRAREVSFRAATRTSTDEARTFAQRAIARNPDLAEAHVELGRTYYRAFTLQWEGSEALDLALAAAQRAIALDQTSAAAHELLGRVYLRRRQHEAAIATLEKAISLNPSRAESYASLADALTFAGRAGEAVPLLQKAMRMDPLYPPRTDMYLGRALYFDKQYDRAVLSLEACVARAPEFHPCRMYLAAAYAELDRLSDARRTVAKLVHLAPAFSVERSVRSHLPYVDGVMQQYTASLAHAGAPP